jgi:hypothetical protein
MILYWPSWKGAAHAYAHAHRLTVPPGFNPASNRYGPDAQALVRHVQHHADMRADAIIGPGTRRLLRPWVSPADMHAGMVWFGHRGARDQPSIHYAQIRPIPHDYRLPLTTDCSGWDTLCCELVGANDPNGFHFTGIGNTTTMLANASPISRAMLSAGCHVLFSSPDHVGFVVKPGPDPLLSSHGSEGGPLLIPLSVEARFHRAVAGYRALRRL